MGLAMSDPMGILAQGLPTLESSGRRKDLDALGALVQEKEIAEIVVGHPLSMDGSRGQMTEFAERLAEDLRARTGLPVSLWDERLSSVEAERALIARNVRREDRKGLRDRVAAALILQGFLDARSSGFADGREESGEDSGDST
jgi:putative Holliday junction resolvase